MTSAALLTEMRTAAGLTQAGLARRSGVARTAINAYESDRRIPTATTLFRLAEACDLELALVQRPRVDVQANARALEEALDLAELLPSRRRGALTFPPLAR